MSAKDAMLEQEAEQQDHGEDSQDSELPQREPWIDKGYVEPQAREVSCEGLAILDPENYSGFKNLDVNLAKLHFEHELPPGYKIVKRIGHGAFGCCFLVEKQTDSVNFGPTRRLMRLPDTRQGTTRDLALINSPGLERAAEIEPTGYQVVLKVVRSLIKPRRPVLFYKACSLYTIMITLKALPLTVNNLKFILGMLKFLHTEHIDVHGDLNPGNMMYVVKDITLPMRDLCNKCGTHDQKTQAHVLKDFIDHWFSMGDEQYECIIDADIGGKIGEPKIVVNHLHHDPRNSTWQVSDDLIGLMNWVIIQTDHHVQSHATRGVVYDITLKSLQHLHAHIISLYEHLDNRFIFQHLRAPQEPFKLQLSPGKCYLDELLEGNFLNFKSFKGSYSLASATATVTSCVKMEVLEVTTAVPVTPEDLLHMFSKIALHHMSSKTASDEYLSTLNTVLNLLTGLLGGVVFVVLDKKYKDKLQILPLDNGLLTRLCQCKAYNVREPLFMHLLHAFCTPSETDRWSQSILEKLAANCGNRSLEMSPELSALRMQPKDGAFVLSCRGTVLAAAAHLKFLPQQYQLRKADGTCFGTRHAAALATAEWMRLEGVIGTVFVRSETGGVHVIFPHGQTLPESKEQECPWIAKDGQKLPQVLFYQRMKEKGS